jgi:hypothetical protein
VLLQLQVRHAFFEAFHRSICEVLAEGQRGTKPHALAPRRAGQSAWVSCACRLM